MRHSMKMSSIFLSTILLLSVTASATAQEATSNFNVGADVVSSYVWRGVPQDVNNPKGTPNIQPYTSYTIGDLTIGAWGSGSFTGTVKEFDFYATYVLSELFSVTLTDYNWNFSQSYFNYGDGTDHVFEGTVSYAGIESFPLSASINTLFYGADLKNKNLDGTGGEQAYSTYVELGYPLASNAKLFLGASLFESDNYVTQGFGITNIGIKVSKSVEITEKISLPVYGIAGINPTAENAFLVVGLTL